MRASFRPFRVLWVPKTSSDFKINKIRGLRNIVTWMNSGRRTPKGSLSFSVGAAYAIFADHRRCRLADALTFADLFFGQLTECGSVQFRGGITAVQISWGIGPELTK